MDGRGDLGENSGTIEIESETGFGCIPWWMHRYHRIAGIIAAALFLVWLAWPVGPLFPCDYSRVVYDRGGRVLRITLSADGQVRFHPRPGALPDKYVKAAITCEDRRFFFHPGVDPFALARSAAVNLRSGRRVRGGSTIPMQVARLRRPKRRTYRNKFFECADALKLSMRFSKGTLLQHYAAHIPLGGNTVGLDAASWRYLGKPAEAITWAEAALFAVLPNAPSMINLEKKRPALKARRDRALGVLLQRGIIDSTTCALARDEELPPIKGALPFHAPHFAHLALRRTRQEAVRTPLDLSLQQRVEEIVAHQHRDLAGQGIRNIAVLVTETPTGAIRAYAGSQDFSDSVNRGQVDGVRALRSTGSLLKPFLVAKVLDRGPHTMESAV